MTASLETALKQRRFCFEQGVDVVEVGRKFSALRVDGMFELGELRVERLIKLCRLRRERFGRAVAEQALTLSHDDALNRFGERGAR